jgi:glycosyltransferase involved in cell wall biosynthesis
MNKRKNILCILGASNVYGAEIVTLSVLTGLKKDYNIHCIIWGWNDGDFKNRLENEDIAYSEIKLGWYYISKPLWSLDSLVHSPGALFNFYKISRQFNPDIIYVINYRNLVLLYPLINKKIIYHVHDANSTSKQHRFFLKLIDKKVSKYLAVSNFIKDDLVKCQIDAEKIEVVHNGIMIPILIKQTKMQPYILRIGIVGQIIPRKGHNLLIKALGILNSKSYKFICKIFGKGDENYIYELKNEIERLNMTDKIQWRGFVNSHEEIYNDIDLLIAPTITGEPFGMISIEAQAYGIPVIASDSGGFKENILNGRTGFLFKPNDVNELSEKIAEFIKCPELLSKLGGEARNNIEKNFHKDGMLRKIKEVIEVL